MKAIETRYKGYRFRSRLEARWAVFFDALGVAWEYEPEGFELGGGVRYLPDFRLLNFFPRYVEVKPVADDFAKADRFARVSGNCILLAEGVPDFKTYAVLDPDLLKEDRESYKQFGWFSDSAIDKWRCLEWGDYYPSDHSWLQRAVAACRGARFEFGESGARA